MRRGNSNEEAYLKNRFGKFGDPAFVPIPPQTIGRLEELEVAARNGKYMIEDLCQETACRWCLAVDRLITMTVRWCATCESAFCAHGHGNFAGGRGRCVVCGADSGSKVVAKPFA